MLLWALLNYVLASRLSPFAAWFLLCCLLGHCLSRGLFLFGFSFHIFVFFLVFEGLKLEALSCLGMNTAGACLQSSCCADNSAAALAQAQVVVSHEQPLPSGFAWPCLPCCPLHSPHSRRALTPEGLPGLHLPLELLLQ